MKRTISIILSIITVISMFMCLATTASAASELKIPSGAKYYKGHMYYVYKSDASWTKAKKLCENRGGHLVTITSKGENNFVADLVTKKNIGYCFYGASDAKTEGKWRWVTGEKFKYKFWADSQPDNYSPVDDSVENYLGSYCSDNRSWNDFCNKPFDVAGYVCEWEVGKTTGIEQVSASSSSVTLSWNDNNYVSKYIVYYYDTSAKKYIKYKTVEKTSITIKGLEGATTYKIAISNVFKNNGKSKTAPKVTFNVVTKPGTAKKLKIEDKISLVWSKVKGADGYVVYMYNNDREKWEVFDTVKKNSCKIGKKFGSEKQTFKVRAYKKSTDGTKFYGGYSNTVKR